MRFCPPLQLSSGPASVTRERRSLAGPTGEAVSRRPRLRSYDEFGAIARQQPPVSLGQPASQARWFSPVFAAILAVIVGSMGLVGLKERIVRVFPATSSLYAAAGLPVNLRGLEFRGVKSALSEDGPQRFLKVRGEIANLRTGQNVVPQIELVVSGADGRPAYSWTALAPKTKLAANETIMFETRLVSPPAAARDVTVRFAKAD
ncbi:MAG: hypothetical protein NVSMB26_20250 [Beijerinckiaceae bacterium]